MTLSRSALIVSVSGCILSLFFWLIGHPPARETSQDGQYESGVRERVNLTPMPGRPEVNHLT